MFFKYFVVKEATQEETIYFRFLTSVVSRGWRKWGGRGGVRPPDFGRIEGAASAGQRRRAALLHAHPDFQTLPHPCNCRIDSNREKESISFENTTFVNYT